MFYDNLKSLFICIALVCALMTGSYAYAVDESYDELDDIYSQIESDNDSLYVDTNKGQQLKKQPTQAESLYEDDDLSVYEDDIYGDEEYRDNDDSYSNTGSYDPDADDGAYIPYPYDNDQNYLPQGNVSPDDFSNDLEYYDNQYPIDNDREYTPSDDFYPDYYNQF